MPIPADYLTALASQLGSISAFLGGFAATFLATLLVLPHKGRAATGALALASLASVAFILAVVASTVLTADLHPHAPVKVAERVTTRALRVMLLSFALGTYALLGAVATSGWCRSRLTGWITTAIGALGAAAVTALIAQAG